MESSKHIGVLKQDHNEIHLAFRGEFIITHIKRVYEEFQELMNVSEKNVFITLKEIKSLDLTGVQLIVALKKTLESIGKQVILELVYPKEVENLLKINGFYTL